MFICSSKDHLTLFLYNIEFENVKHLSCGMMRISQAFGGCPGPMKDCIMVILYNLVGIVDTLLGATQNQGEYIGMLCVYTSNDLTTSATGIL